MATVSRPDTFIHTYSHSTHRGVGWWLSIAVFFVASAHAHKLSDSYLTLVPQADQIDVRWDVALRDLDPELGLDVNDDGLLSWGEIRTRARDIASFITPQLRVSAQNTACLPVQDSTENRGTQFSLSTHSDGVYAVLQYRLRCAAQAEMIDVDYRLFSTTDPTHRGIVRVFRSLNGSPTDAADTLGVLGPSNPHHVFALRDSSRLSTLRSLTIEGIWHIWLGFDHILFLLTLLLPSVLLARANPPLDRSEFTTTAFDVLRIVTAFTLAHSLTLTLAVLNWVSLPSRLVEAGIAVTVLLGALNNLWPVVHERRWIAAFAFGLIHGFGFAAALKALDLSNGALALSLFGFNLGVEIGQLAIVAAFVPLAFVIRRTNFYRYAVMRGGSVVIALIAAVWFIERAWDVKLMSR